MNLLITYASNSGGTHLVTQQIEKALSSKATKITVKKARDTKVSDFDKNDIILIGSPSWWVNDEQGKPHQTVLDLMKRLEKHDLSKKSFALFGCGDSSYIKFCGAVDELENFVEKKKASKILESLRIDGYFFDLEENIKAVDSWVQTLSKKMPVSSIA